LHVLHGKTKGQDTFLALRPVNDFDELLLDEVANAHVSSRLGSPFRSAKCPNPNGSERESQPRSEPPNAPESLPSEGKYAYANLANLRTRSESLSPEFPFLIFDPTLPYT
jgi:hypothetical protein